MGLQSVLYHLTNYNYFFFTGRPLCTIRQMWRNALCAISDQKNDISI